MPAAPAGSAILEFDRPGGVLQARELSQDSSFEFWPPPNGQPMPIGRDQPL
ncbi:MAG: hypothetical protein U1D55_12850 [Phycisphaerae bacterium]